MRHYSGGAGWWHFCRCFHLGHRCAAQFSVLGSNEMIHATARVVWDVLLSAPGADAQLHGAATHGKLLWNR